MLAGATTGRRLMYGTVAALMLPFASQVAEARGFAHHHWHYGFGVSGLHSFRHWGGGLQCVAFVREETRVQLIGNAANWWNAAAGIYDRGNVPQPGAVLVFRGTGRMRLGHVAVVRDVVGPREIEIDHAHWAGGGVYRGVSVIDVSRENDWTDVRVAIRPGAKYGSAYPTYGFIYDRTPQPRLQTAQATASPPARVQLASATDPAPARVQPASAPARVQFTIEPAPARVQSTRAADAAPARVQFTIEPAPARVQFTSTTDRVPARVQLASATDSMAAPVQFASALDWPNATDITEPAPPMLRTRPRRHWRRLVARRHAIDEVAEQPAGSR